MSSKKNVIRTIYLYLFSLAGLIMTMVGCSMLVHTALTNTVFKSANSRFDYYANEPSSLANADLENTKAILETLKSDKDLTDTQKEKIDTWLTDYSEYRVYEQQRKEYYTSTEYKRRDMEENLATSLSLIAIGLPIYLIHWFTIKSDIKKEKEDLI